MIGWENVASRDYGELVLNGRVDDDLEAMQKTIAIRQAAIKIGGLTGIELRTRIEAMMEADQVPLEELRRLVVEYEPVP